MSRYTWKRLGGSLALPLKLMTLSLPLYIMDWPMYLPAYETFSGDSPSPNVSFHFFKMKQNRPAIG